MQPSMSIRWFAVLGSLIATSLTSLVRAEPQEPPVVPATGAEPPPAAVETGPATPTVPDAGAAPSATPLTVRPARAVVPRCQSTNVDEERAKAFAEVLARAYQSETKGRVMPPHEVEALGDVPLERVVEAAGATEYFECSLVGLDAKIVVWASVLDAGHQVKGTRELTAIGADDFEPIATRMAKAFANDVSVDATRDRNSVTQDEARKKPRSQSEQVAVIRGGPVFPIAGEAVAPLASAAIDVRYESQQSSVGFGFGLLLPTTSDSQTSIYGGVSAEVMGGYYLTSGNNGVYVGGGMLARILNSGGNIAPFVTLGAMFDRAAGSHFLLELRGAQNVTPITLTRESADEFTGYEETESEAYPFEPSLHAGVAW